MPKFVHESPDAKALFETLGAEKNLLPLLIEKDYWVMHCLWGLQQKGFKFEMKDGTSLSKGWRCIDRFSEDIDIRFEPSEGLNLNGEKRAHIEARFEFYDGLAKEVEIPGIAVQRNRAFDDAKARNGGLSLRFDSYFNPLPELKPEVLLEIGFARTAPNEPKDFTSWALERALQANVDVEDAKEFASLRPFAISDDKTYRLFEKEFESIDSLLLSPGPTFKDVMERIRTHCQTSLDSHGAVRT